VLLETLAFLADFTEVRGRLILRSSAYLLCHGAHTTLEHIHSPKTLVCYSCYVVSRRRVKAQDGYLFSH
jgi:hypothetical protein